MLFKTNRQRILGFIGSFGFMFLFVLVSVYLEEKGATLARAILSVIGFFCFAYSVYLLVMIFCDLIVILVDRKRNKVLSRYFENVKFDDLQRFNGKNFTCVYGRNNEWCTVYVTKEKEDAFFTISNKGVEYSKAFSLIDDATKQVILEKFEKELLEAKALHEKELEEGRLRAIKVYQKQAEIIKKVASEN